MASLERVEEVAELSLDEKAMKLDVRYTAEGTLWKMGEIFQLSIELYDTKNNIIGCIHAGWKGASSGIIENTVKKFKKISSKNKIFASVGPCIGLKSYEVDLNFYKRFVTKSKNNTTYFLKKNH